MMLEVRTEGNTLWIKKEDEEEWEKLNTIDLWKLTPRTNMPLFSMSEFGLDVPKEVVDDGIEKQDISKLFEEKVKQINNGNK